VVPCHICNVRKVTLLLDLSRALKIIFMYGNKIDHFSCALELMLCMVGYVIRFSGTLKTS
jgi:hypothetical protein